MKFLFLLFLSLVHCLAFAGTSGQSLFNIQSKWKTSDGNEVMLASLKGKNQLVAMLYTSCPTACPMIVEDMNSIRARLPADLQGKLNLAAFSFDPSRDTPDHLKAFVTKRRLDLSYWKLMSPVKDSSANELAAALGVRFKKVKNDYVHSNVLFLLNENGEIVSSKEGLGNKSESFDRAVLDLLKNKPSEERHL
jgi:protein SCO1